MYTDTEGIVLRQVKTAGGRRMILLFSKKYGKISAGTGINEKGRGKSALALRPFTYGKYELFKSRESYNINGAEVIKSYYSMGEDVDKYMAGSYILEFTDKLLEEGLPSPELFRLLTEFFEVMERRNKKYSTIVIAYQVKAMEIMGAMPHLDSCVLCGAKEGLSYFSVKDGGVCCNECFRKYNKFADGTLTFLLNFNIINILRYFSDNTLKSLENLALDNNVSGELQRIIKCYAEYHLDIGKLKSENFLHD